MHPSGPFAFRTSTRFCLHWLVLLLLRVNTNLWPFARSEKPKTPFGPKSKTRNDIGASTEQRRNDAGVFVCVAPGKAQGLRKTKCKNYFILFTKQLKKGVSKPFFIPISFNPLFLDVSFEQTPVNRPKRMGKELSNNVQIPPERLCVCVNHFFFLRVAMGRIKQAKKNPPLWPPGFRSPWSADASSFHRGMGLASSRDTQTGQQFAGILLINGMSCVAGGAAHWTAGRWYRKLKKKKRCQATRQRVFVLNCKLHVDACNVCNNINLLVNHQISFNQNESD